MSRLLARCAPLLLLTLLLIQLGLEQQVWLSRNGIPDGYQNEYLHVGNAMDLFGSFLARDAWHLRYYLSTNYWPPGFYLWPWPLMMALGATHRVMVLSNLGHLALLLWSVYRLGELARDRVTGLFAMGLVSLYPAIFGNLMRYEPNVAVAAWVSVAALWWLRSDGLRRRGPALCFGLACGVGLLMDRLSLAVFFVGPVLTALPGLLRRERRVNVGLALLVLLLVAGWWHAAFVHLHLDEVLTQSGAGEIDSTGEMTERRGFFSWMNLLYYPLALIEGQAGLLPGLLALVGLGFAGRRGPVERLCASVALGAMLIFTLLAKKQIYYTVPSLGVLAVLSASWLRGLGRPGVAVGFVVLLAGLHQHGLRLWGRGLPLPAGLAEDLGAASWGERALVPWHPQCLPPRDLELPVDALAASLGEGDIIAFSEDQTWYEGYLVLQLRERLPGRIVRGVVGDPQGSYEWLGVATNFVYVAADDGARWPTEERLDALLRQHHYDPDSLPPVAEAVAEAGGRFEMVEHWPLQDGVQLWVWRER